MHSCLPRPSDRPNTSLSLYAKGNGAPEGRDDEKEERNRRTGGDVEMKERNIYNGGGKEYGLENLNVLNIINILTSGHILLYSGKLSVIRQSIT